MKNPKIAVVIPTIRNLDFLEYWGNEFRECIGIIVEDHQDKEITIPKKYFKEIYHYSWQDIDKELGDNSWIISRKNAGIRSYGFLKAYQLGCEVTLTLDDDCYPIKKQNFLQTHIDNLSVLAPADWVSTYPHRKYYYTRGFPYSVRNKEEVVISHGLWSNILDFDAKTHLEHPGLNMPVLNSNLIEFIPKDYFYPMCSMNLAFKTKITPVMYFPPMGYDNKGNYWGYDRFDDIWAGIFAKKIIDHLGHRVINGSPFVNHKKASDVLKNLKKEAAGVEKNESLYKLINKVELRSKTFVGCYLEIAEKTNWPKSKYFKKLKTAMVLWVKLIR